MSTPLAGLSALATFTARVADADGFEAVVDVALDAIVELFGHDHVLLLLHEPVSGRLVTFASRGYATVGIGSELMVGEGILGTVALGRRSMRIGNLQRMLRYVRSVQRSAAPGVPGAEIRLPGLADARSQLAAPMVARGALLGVIAVESQHPAHYDEVDEHALSVAAGLVASMLDLERRDEPDEPDESHGLVAAPTPEEVAGEPTPVPQPARPPVRIRHYVVDGSTFLDDEYVIKGVAGRLLWKVASEYQASGRTAYSNREARLDPALDMPSFKDNFESRLVLLKRRLEERASPIRIHRPGRGRFAVEVLAPLVLDRVAVSDS